MVVGRRGKNSRVTKSQGTKPQDRFPLPAASAKRSKEIPPSRKANNPLKGNKHDSRQRLSPDKSGEKGKKPSPPPSRPVRPQANKNGAGRKGGKDKSLEQAASSDKKSDDASSMKPSPDRSNSPETKASKAGERAVTPKKGKGEESSLKSSPSGKKNSNSNMPKKGKAAGPQEGQNAKTSKNLPPRKGPRDRSSGKDGQGDDESSPSSRRSKSKSPPAKSPASAKLVKRDGKLVRSGKQVIPDGVLDGRVHKRFPPVAVPHSKGLWNEGNFCYRNGILQTLLHSPPAFRYMGKMHKDCDVAAKRCVVCALQALMQTYWNDPSTPKAPRGPRHEVTVFNEACANNLPGLTSEDLRVDFEEENQSDAFEFLQYLLSQVEDQAQPSDDASFESTFHLQQEENWHCDECGHDHIKLIGPDDAASRFGLKVWIQEPTGLTLMEYIRQTFTGTVNIHCEHPGPCSKKYTKKVRQETDGPERAWDKYITSAPEVLIVHIYRFVKKAPDWVEKKITSDVPFDEYLNLGEFTKDGDDLLYRLDGVLSHMGKNTSEGHYIAVCRESGGRKFVSLNDTAGVGPTKNGRGSFQEMKSPNSLGQKAGQPYVLVYTKL